MNLIVNSVYVLPFVLLCFVTDICCAVEADLTVQIPAGIRECFHQRVVRDVNMEVEYQVIEGGDLDIDFVVKTPTDRVLVTEQGKTEGVHKFKTDEEGDYTMCLDNTFSTFSNKLVFFEVVTDEPDDKNQLKFEFPEDKLEVVDMTIEELREKLERVKGNLDRSVQVQNLIRVFEARDRAQMEHNFERVNYFSCIQLFVMLSVGLVQVLMIRGLFEQKHPKNVQART